MAIRVAGKIDGVMPMADLKLVYAIHNADNRVKSMWHNLADAIAASEEGDIVITHPVLYGLPRV